MSFDTLDKNGPSSSQILDIKESILVNNNSVSKLLTVCADNKALAGFFRKVAQDAMLNVLEDEDESRVQQEVGDKATNLARMSFFDNAAILALRQAHNATMENAETFALIRKENAGVDEEKLKLAMELLRAAAYFGSGRAAQSLIEANEAGVIALDNAELRALVEVQIFWHEAAQKSNVEKLTATQHLPALIGNQKVWAAVREDQALYNKVLEVRYLDSGVACQELIDAHEAGIISLKAEELRALVKNQMDKYVASTTKEGQCVPQLLENPQAWAAMKKAPKESFNLLREFYTNTITQELPNAAQVADAKTVAKTTENNPLAYKDLFENAQTTQVIAQNEERTRVLLAIFALRHAAYAEDQKAIYAMRPAIKEKEEANKKADQESDARIAEKQAELEKLDAEDLKANPNPTETIKYIGAGAHMFDPTKGKTLYESRAELDEKIKKATNQKKLQEYQDRITSGETAYADYEQRKTARATTLAEFSTKEGEARQVRAKDLQVLKTQERTLIQALVDSNPIADSMRLAFLAAAQDYDCYQGFSYDWSNLILTSLQEDDIAYREGDFASEVKEVGALTKTRLVTEGLPIVIFKHAHAYMALLKIYLDNTPETFWKNVCDQLFDANGAVNKVDLNQLFQIHFPNNATGADASIEMIKIITNSTIQAHVDPLLALLNGSMLLALFLSVEQIFPVQAFNAVQQTQADFKAAREALEKRKAEKKSGQSKSHETAVATAKEAADKAYAKFMKQVVVLRERLTKIVNRSFEGMPSRLRNYIEMALIALHDNEAIARIMEGVAEGKNSALYSILLDKNLIKKDEFKCQMGPYEEFATDLLSKAADNDFTFAHIENYAKLVAYLKKIFANTENLEIEFFIQEAMGQYLGVMFSQFPLEDKQRAKLEKIVNQHVGAIAVATEQRRSSLAATRHASVSSVGSDVVSPERDTRSTDSSPVDEINAKLAAVISTPSNEDNANSTVSVKTNVAAAQSFVTAQIQQSSSSADKVPVLTPVPEKPSTSSSSVEVGGTRLDMDADTVIHAPKGFLGDIAKRRQEYDAQPAANDSASTSQVATVVAAAPARPAAPPPPPPGRPQAPALGFLDQIKARGLSEEQVNKAANRISMAVRNSAASKKATKGVGMFDSEQAKKLQQRASLYNKDQDDDAPSSGASSPRSSF